MKNRPNIQTPIPLDQGGTAGTDASSARANLAVPSQTELTDGLNLKEDKANKGSNDGYAGLNAGGQVPLSQGGTESDLSSTGGAGQILKQETSGGSITVGPLQSSDIPSGIEATKIGSGNVSDTEFGHLDGVTSSIQNQLNSKAASSHTHSQYITGSGYAFSYYRYMSFWTSSQTLSYVSNFFYDSLYQRLHVPNIQAQSIPVYGSTGAVLYAYTSGTKGLHHHWSSSRKTKKDIRNMESVGSKLRQLRPVRFKGTTPPKSSDEESGFEESFGLIAEEVAEIFPDLCYKLPGDGEDEVSGVHYDRIPIYLVQAWRELLEECQQMKSKIASLERRLGAQDT